jgi:hypothetical protein
MIHRRYSLQYRRLCEALANVAMIGTALLVSYWILRTGM